MPKPSLDLSFRLIAIVICLFAILPLALGGWGYFRTTNFIATASSAQGEVIDLIENNGSEGGSTYAPRIKFTESSGKVIEATSSTSSSPPRYQPGDVIEILYDSKNPQDFRTTDWFSLWGLAIIGLSIGGFITLFALAFAFLGPIILRGFRTKNGEQVGAHQPATR